MGSHRGRPERGRRASVGPAERVFRKELGLDAETLLAIFVGRLDVQHKALEVSLLPSRAHLAGISRWSDPTGRAASMSSASWCGGSALHSVSSSCPRGERSSAPASAGGGKPVRTPVALGRAIARATPSAELRPACGREPPGRTHHWGCRGGGRLGRGRWTSARKPWRPLPDPIARNGPAEPGSPRTRVGFPLGSERVSLRRALAHAGLGPVKKAVR